MDMQPLDARHRKPRAGWAAALAGAAMFACAWGTGTARAALVEIRGTVADPLHLDAGTGLPAMRADRPASPRLVAAARDDAGRAVALPATEQSGMEKITHAGGIEPLQALVLPRIPLEGGMETPDEPLPAWAILLVAAGLVGYQIRRKSRAGAIRVRADLS